LLLRPRRYKEEDEVNNGPTLQQGSTGNDVRRLQRLFVMMKELDYTGIDGVFGAKTDAAVRAFQQGNGLVVDGIVGPATWAKLPADPNTPLLQQGATGAVVQALQKVLHTFASGSGIPDPGPADGVFGPHTKVAVEGYQGDRGVTADGIVGDRTWWVPAGAAGATLASLAGLTTV
jgi:peptidoglycan hydrolase-like protein with peptidoglycan-binding domain